jgi:hypothetical protein
MIRLKSQKFKIGYDSGVPIVIPYAIEGGGRPLSEMAFLIDFWSLNTIPLDIWQKIQDGIDIRVGRKSIFLP